MPHAPTDPQDIGPVSHALILQGGGALGSYQAGVYQALHEAGIAPDWIAGISIGAVNAALIAGNEPHRRLERLEEFWEGVTRPSLPALPWEGDASRKWLGALSAMNAQLFGQPGFFQPNLPNPWFAPPGSRQASAYYDTAPLVDTLRRLVDFERLNGGEIRCAVGAVHVETGNFAYFDNHDSTAGPATRLSEAHIMASGALPPGFPPVMIEGEAYWDGGLVSNTPLQHLLENCQGRDLAVFQVDLFSARGPLPRDMMEVMTRQKDITYSSRTRAVSDHFHELIQLKRQLRRALQLVPKGAMPEDERARLMDGYGLHDLPRVSLMQLVYRQEGWEGEHKDYEFSRRTMRAHWEAGHRDTKATLAHKDWLEPPTNGEALEAHDVHRERE